MMSEPTSHPGPDAKTIPCVVYAAKSTMDPNGSIQRQIEDAKAAVEREGGRWVAGVFSDENKSAFHGNRGDGLADAKALVIELAAKHGHAELWVQHSDRLSRGDGLSADHLAEIWFSMRRHAVRLRSVQDDSNLEDAIRTVLIGERNTEDSKRKSQAVASGYNGSAERGDASYLFRGIPLGGYEPMYSYEGSRRKITAIKHPEDKWIYELIFEMARAGHSEQSIQLELSTRGAKTRPHRKDHRSRPFDASRVGQVLNNPAYAGVLTHNGERYEGRWPRYIDIEEFDRLRAEREARSHATKRKAGRPAIGYLLTEVAVCGVCFGPCRVMTTRPSRATSTPRRRYICKAHLDHHPDSEEFCPALPYDAELADKIVLSGLDKLLGDAASLREQLNAGRVAQVERMGEVARSAREEAAKVDRAITKAQAHYERALAEGDDETADIALTAVRNLRSQGEQARQRLNAALDAINAEPRTEDEDVLNRVWEVLSGRMKDAEGDLKKLTAALREWFQGFGLQRGDDGSLSVVPILSASAIARILKEPNRWPTQIRELGTDLPATSESTALAVGVPLLSDVNQSPAWV
jgi:DNA invertase Pin-like site-specific DNA recombinase